MASYEVEHGVKDELPAQGRRPRVDLSSFFSALDVADTSGARRPSNQHSVPMPSDIAAPYTLLGDAFRTMNEDQANDLLLRLAEELSLEANNPPKEVKGVPDTFLVDLERVPKAKLVEGDSCPICSEPFLNDKYAYVVRLPCHKDHLFDYECIRPWLKLQNTCPLDRKKVWEKKHIPPPADDDEEEYDDMYA